MGKRLSWHEEYERARSTLLRVLWKDRYNAKTYYLLGKISNSAKNLTYFEEASRLSPNDKDTLWAICNVLKRRINNKEMSTWKTENLKKAKSAAERLLLLSNQSEKTEVYKFLAFLARKENKPDEAIDFLQSALKIFPNDPETYVELSMLAREMRAYDSALSTAKRIIDLLPNGFEGYYDAGLALIFMGRYEEAAKYLEQATERNPKYHLNYTQLAKCYLSLGEYQKAEEGYNKALKLFSNERPALFGLANIYVDTGKYKEAIDILKSLLSNPGNDSEFIVRRGISWLHNRAYLNVNTLPNIAGYFRVAQNKAGDLYAQQIDSLYEILVRPDSQINTEGWDEQTLSFFSALRYFLRLKANEEIADRRSAYEAIQKSLRNPNMNSPILRFFRNNWNSIERFLDSRYHILPNLLLNFNVKANLLVHEKVTFTTSILNLGVYVAKNVKLKFQRSGKFRIHPEEFSFDSVSGGESFQVEFEPVEEGPVQLTATAEVENLGTFQNTYDLMAFRRNPYFYGRPVHTPEMFFGRQDLIDKIIARITSVVKQDLFITGIRRIGKTSLLYQLKNKLLPPFFPILFSFQQVGEITDDIAIIRQLFFQIMDDLNASHGKFRGAFRTLHLPLVDNQPYRDFDLVARDFRRSYESLSRLLSQIEPGLRIVILLDEGDTLFQIESRCQHFFRDLLQKYESLVMIIAGSPRIRELSGHDFSSPFFNIFAKYDIKGLEKDAIFDLINKPMEAANLIVTPGAQDAIYRLCGGHPHLLQAICYYLVEGMYRKKDRQIGVEELKQAEQRVLGELKESYNGIWNELLPEEKTLLSTLARGNISLSEARKICHKDGVDRLVEFELSKKSDSEIEISSGLIRSWTLMKEYAA